MAYYVVLASVVDLLQDIMTHLQPDPSFPHSGREMAMISDLHKKFTGLLESLQGYSSKGDRSAKNLENRIRDAAYQAQDIIEFASPGQINSEDEVLRKVRQEVDSIVKEVEKMKATQSLEDLQLGDVAVGGGVCEQTPATSDTPVGFTGDLNKIKDKLCGDSTRFQVIPIFGMGGIGKTTLARNTFDDDQIKNCFDFRAWVTVSQHYSLERLVRGILESFDILSSVLSIVEKEISKEELEKRERDLKRLVKASEKQARALEKGEKADKKTLLDEATKKVDALKERLTTLKKQLKELKKTLKGEQKALMKGKKKGEEEHQYSIEEVEEDAEEGDVDTEEEKETEEVEEHAEEWEEDTGEEGNTQEVDREQKALHKRMIYLHKYLYGRKYLVVVDDVWNSKVWDEINRSFPKNENGSGILVTTRLEDVAKYMCTSEESLHKMDLLGVDDSWNLFLGKLVNESENFPSELVDIGRFILSKCNGLPLAIVVIAGMLSSDMTPQHWQRVAKNVGSALSQAKDDHLPNILSLSYNHLPHLHKACFLYMMIFPEDYEIDISKLIRLWIAEGLVRSVDGSQTLERVAEECLHDLVRRSLVIITKKRAGGAFKLCVIHDVLRDFCRPRALSEYSFHVLDQSRHAEPSGTEKVRRVIVDSFVPAAIPWTYDTSKYIHTFQWFGRSSSSDIHRLDWGGFKHLKIMDVSDAEISVAPFAVSRMFHLKYLALRLTSRRTKHIPPSIFKFQNLQTLIIYAPNCANIILPAEIWEMVQLRHIIIDQMILPPMDGSSPLQKLEYLQTLQTVKNFTFTDQAIKIILNLRILKISYEGGEVNGMWRLYCLINLVHLSLLEELKITITATQFTHDHSFPSVPGVFPPNLVKLSLVGCKLQWGELTMAVKLLEKLQDLRLHVNAVVGEKWTLPEEWELPKLKFLMMENLDIKCWEADSACFPCLEHLKISKCHELAEIPLEIGCILSLKLIEVYNSKGAGGSVSFIVEERDLLEYDKLKVDIDGKPM